MASVLYNLREEKSIAFSPDAGFLKVGTHSELNTVLDEFVKSVQTVLIDKSEHIFYNSMVQNSLRRHSKAFSNPLFRS